MHRYLLYFWWIFFLNPLSMCWIGRMYLSFDPGWWMGFPPVSRSIFELTQPSDACIVPTCKSFPWPWLTFCTQPENPVATLFLFGNRIPPSMGQFRGVYNRHARTSKTFPYFPKPLPLYLIRYDFVPNSEINFVLNAKERRKTCQERWWGSGNWEFMQDRTSESLVQCHCLE